MEVELILSREEMKDFKCYFCGHYLSVGPVMTNFGRYTFKCGRCYDVDIENSTKHSIPWGKVQRHETNCEHRGILCPILTPIPCKRHIEITKLQSHFLEKHSSNLCHDRVLFLYKENLENVTFLLVKETFHYLVYVYRMNKIHMYVSVFSINDDGPYTNFNVTFAAVGCNTGPTLLFGKGEIGYTVYKCLHKLNHFDDYKIGQISEAFGVKIEESCIRYCLKQNKITCTITVGKYTKIPFNDDQQGSLEQLSAHSSNYVQTAGKIVRQK